MKAALVQSFDQPPQYGEAPAPQPGAGETVIDVLAAAATPLVKAQASGKHYSSVNHFPLIPGNDGVGRLPSGQLAYFVVADLRQGSMAEQTLAKADALVPLPAGLDPIRAAVIANPGMSSWAGLSYRAKLVPGETVFIHGATGSAGRMAVQIAKLLGAKHVIAAGRNEAVLESLRDVGADTCFSLNRTPDEIEQDLRERVLPLGVNVILDYLWGTPTENLLRAFVGHGHAEGEPKVRLVQIGTSAGANLTLPGATLRASGLELMGSGFGSVPLAQLLEAIGGLFEAALTTDFKVEAEVVPLSGVEAAWNQNFGERRLVLKPS